MRRLFVPTVLALIFALGTTAVQAGNQEEANKIAQRLGQQFPQYNIEVAYQEGNVRLRGEISSDAERAEILRFVKRIPKVRSVQESFSVTAVNPYSNQGMMYSDSMVRPVQAVTPMAESNISPVVVPLAESNVSNEYVISTDDNSMVPTTAAPQATATKSPSDFMAPQGYNMTAGQNGQPNLPNYAWPSYADYPNYSQVTYPKQYSAGTFPYIGPFYPYPQVPLGWRKVTMEWHDGYWWLDFNDGSCNGPFSPLFRQPSKYR